MDKLITTKSGDIIMDLELTYYFSAPMSGYEEYNYPYFERVVTHLRSSGIKIVSPHEVKPPVFPELLDISEKELWKWYLEKDLVLMIQNTQGIILGKGWPESRGARVELEIAMTLGRPVFYYEETEDRITRMSTNTDYVGTL